VKKVRGIGRLSQGKRLKERDYSDMGEMHGLVYLTARRPSQVERAE
jgi:hypothetical protein